MSEQGNELRHTSDLTSKQALYVEALASGKSLDAAAAAAGIVERTGRKWRGLPTVQAALREARSQALGDVTTKAVARMTAALDVLTLIMADKTISPAVRVSAARTILESAVRFSETLDLSERVSALEASREFNATP